MTYVVLKEAITVEGANTNNRTNKSLPIKNNASFRSCKKNKQKNNNTFIDNVKDLNIIKPMYNLLEYSDSYSMTSGSLWNYHTDEVNDVANENNCDNYSRSNNNTTTGKSFE